MHRTARSGRAEGLGGSGEPSCRETAPAHQEVPDVRGGKEVMTSQAQDTVPTTPGTDSDGRMSMEERLK